MRLHYTSISVEVESLGPLLGQIVVALSPFISKHTQAVADIFKFLIIESKYVTLISTHHKSYIFVDRSILGPYFNEVYLMPEVPELADVNRALKEHSHAPKR